MTLQKGNLMARHIRGLADQGHAPGIAGTFRDYRIWKIVLGCVFALALVSITEGFGASPAARFTRISVEQGLSQSTVQAILQDHVGFLWFGTDEGLNRYDGYTCVVFVHDSQDPQSLPNNVVSVLHEDRQRRLWVGTKSGLALFDRRTETFSNVPSIHERVTCILEDTDGTLWFGTEGDGLFERNPVTDAFLRHIPDIHDPSSLVSRSVSALLRDRGGRLWIGTRYGGVDLLEQGGKRFVHHRHDAKEPRSLTHDEVWGLAEDALGNVWVATYGGGLSVLDHTSREFRHYRHQPGDPKSIESDLMTSVFVDRSGTIWVGTDGAGLLQYDAASDRFLAHTNDRGDPTSLSQNVVRAIYEDAQAQLWVGTYLGGANVLKRPRRAFGYFTHSAADPSSLSDPTVAAILEDTEGRIWIGMNGGWINRYERQTGSFARYRFPSNAPRGSTVLALHQDRRGRIWVGTYRGGLGQFDPARGAFITYRHRDGDPRSVSSNEIWAIADDQDGALLLGTSDGMDRFDPESGSVTTHYEAGPNGLVHHGLRSFLIDQRGDLWIGTIGGLDLLRRGTASFVHYRHDESDPHSLSHDGVLALHEDREGRLWVGTNGGGLNLVDQRTETFTSYRQFPSNSIYRIEEDSASHLWLSTNHGLSRFDPNKGTIENFDLTNGLQGLQFHLGASLRTRNGRLLFGSINGFYDFDPEAIKPDTFAPPVVITSLRIFNEPANLATALSTRSEVTLSPGDKVFSFEFAALDYTLPRRNRYSYRMEGFSDQWMDLGAKREVTFTNLDPGSYTFQVKASNSDGVWNEASAAVLRVVVRPAFWRTWWFRGLSAALIVLAVLAAHRVRVRRLTADIAERKRAEQALRASEERYRSSEERYRALYDDTPSIYFTVHPTGTVLSVNRFGAAYLGYSTEELVGQSVLQVFIESDRSAAATHLAECVAHPGRLFHWELRKARKAGRVLWVKETAQAMRDRDGELVVLVVCEDISERKRAEDALRDSEEKYRRFFEEDLSADFISTPDGCVLACNPAFVSLFGFASVDDAMGRNIASLDESMGGWESFVQSIREQSKLEYHEAEFRREDGSLLNVIANVVGTFNDQHELVELRGYLLDNTEHKKLEQQFLQAQKMDAIGRLAGGVAHDFNNWLTPIIGYSQLVLRSMDTSDPHRREVEEIGKAGQRASALASQLLAFSRKQVWQPRVVDLNQIVADMDKMLRRMIGEDIQLVAHLDPALGQVKADPGQIEQVILNLILNARDAMPKGGKLTIETSNDDFDQHYVRQHLGTETGPWVMLAVSDTGCGMDPQIQAQVFEPFFTTKERGKGTGLGLSMVYGIVKQSGGTVSIYSELGKGTCLKIYLPRIDEPAGMLGAADTDRLPQGSETVLLVVDEPMVRDFIAAALRGLGYTVMAVEGGEEALSLAEAYPHEIHLLLTDVVMPRMSGPELAARFPVLRPGTKVLYVSGYTGDAIVHHGILESGVPFLQKPFTPDVLARKLRDVLDT